MDDNANKTAPRLIPCGIREAIAESGGHMIGEKIKTNEVIEMKGLGDVAYGC